MATPEHEAFYEGVPINPTYHVVNGNMPYVCVVMKIIEGPLAGREFKFERNKWDTKGNVFAFRNMRALGWQGKTVATFVDDVRAFMATGKTVQFQARLAEFGKATWWTADKIGQGTTTLIKQGTPATAETTAFVDDMIAEADEADAAYRSSRANSDDGGYGNRTPSNGDDDLVKAGYPCRECGEPLFEHKDGYLTCKNGHDTIPF